MQNNEIIEKYGDNRPIALFDSGIGGLFFLKKIVDEMPFLNIIYFADEKFFPYGVKDESVLKDRVERVSSFLCAKKAKLIAIACNTASAYKSICLNYCPLSVDVLSLLASSASLKTVNKKIAVIGTAATVNKGKYRDFFKSLGIEVFQIACDSLVFFAENAPRFNQEANILIEKLCNKIKEASCDTLVLGCTHFLVFKDEFIKNLRNANVVSGEDEFKKTVENRLIEAHLLSNCGQKGSLNVYTTDKKSAFEKKLALFKFFDYHVEEVIV